MTMVMSTYKTPFALDNIVDESGNHVAFALTKRNIDFVETAVSLDSNYKAQYFKNSGATPGNHFLAYVKSYPFVDTSGKSKSGKGWSKGSIAYWYNQLQYGKNCSYEQSLFAIVSIVDSLNSTHLNACKNGNGRAEMTKLIIEKWGDNFSNLCSTLDKDDPDSVYLISNEKLCGERYSFSFASKIYFYLHEKFAKSNTRYPVSKYDQIVARNLHKYVEFYLSDPSKNEKSYLISKSSKKKDKEKIYKSYQDDIGKIIASLKTKGININRKEFDHLVWWTNK